MTGNKVVTYNQFNRLYLRIRKTLWHNFFLSYLSQALKQNCFIFLPCGHLIIIILYYWRKKSFFANYLIQNVEANR